MNLKLFMLLLFSPVLIPLMFTALLLAALVVAVVPLSDEECVEFGIVPARRRYDSDFVARVQSRAMGGNP